mmetsp:Transcript_142006/g.247356  ORF Transcript_142006/g.247356 Transcript_142006/m.247356 type:complete len:190 (+) Transcript_142006:1371-1940(+)
MASRATLFRSSDPDRDDLDDRDLGGGVFVTSGGAHGTFTLWQPLGWCSIRDFCIGDFARRGLVVSQLARPMLLHVLGCCAPGADRRGVLDFVSRGTPTVWHPLGCRTGDFEQSGSVWQEAVEWQPGCPTLSHPLAYCNRGLDGEDPFLSSLLTYDLHSKVAPPFTFLRAELTVLRVASLLTGEPMHARA